MLVGACPFGGETRIERDLLAIEASGQLTTQQARIARLARDGLSNHEIGAGARRPGRLQGGEDSGAIASIGIAYRPSAAAVRDAQGARVRSIRAPSSRSTPRISRVEEFRLEAIRANGHAPAVFSRPDSSRPHRPQPKD